MTAKSVDDLLEQAWGALAGLGARRHECIRRGRFTARLPTLWGVV